MAIFPCIEDLLRSDDVSLLFARLEDEEAGKVYGMTSLGRLCVSSDGWTPLEHSVMLFLNTCT